MKLVCPNCNRILECVELDSLIHKCDCGKEYTLRLLELGKSNEEELLDRIEKYISEFVKEMKTYKYIPANEFILDDALSALKEKITKLRKGEGNER
jgi:guanylate kinase